MTSEYTKKTQSSAYTYHKISYETATIEEMEKHWSYRKDGEECVGLFKKIVELREKTDEITT